MEVQDHGSTVTLSGDIDVSSMEALFQLEEKLVGRPSIVFDVAGVKHVDSTFLRFLVKLQAYDAPMSVELVGVTPHLRRILEITGLSRSFV